MHKQTATVFLISTKGQTNRPTIKQLGSPHVSRKYSSLVPVTTGGQVHLLGYDPARAGCDVYAVSTKSPGLTPVVGNPNLGPGKDIVNSFVLGNLPYVAAYTAEKGVFEVYLLGTDFTLSKSYEFYRNHELAVSKGFTTVKPFSLFGQVYFLGYRDDTGYVAMYSASTIVSSPASNVPPLVMLPVWAHPWAPGWTRFAFFSLGGEVFFLKTNTSVLNVNIDHVLDAPASGTTEVGTHLETHLPDALKLTNVEPVIVGSGEPHFVTYRDDTGAATLNRIHGDCLGWTQVAQFSAPKKSTVVAPVVVDGQSMIVFV